MEKVAGVQVSEEEARAMVEWAAGGRGVGYGDFRDIILQYQNG